MVVSLFGRLCLNKCNCSAIADNPLLGDNIPKSHLDRYLAQLGDEGWELVALITMKVDSIMWFFKRPRFDTALNEEEPIEHT